MYLCVSVCTVCMHVCRLLRIQSNCVCLGLALRLVNDLRSRSRKTLSNKHMKTSLTFKQHRWSCDRTHIRFTLTVFSYCFLSQPVSLFIALAHKQTQMHTAVAMMRTKNRSNVSSHEIDFSFGKAFHLFISKTYVCTAHPHAHSEGEECKGG